MWIAWVSEDKRPDFTRATTAAGADAGRVEVMCSSSNFGQVLACQTFATCTALVEELDVLGISGASVMFSREARSVQ